MHPANQTWWAYCRRQYPLHFTRAWVLEFGSYNINGTVRDYFGPECEYYGIDWRPGPGVDIVCLAHELDRPQVDIVISASLLEHDPYWDKSLANMVRHLKHTGLLLLSWGAALNPEHCLKEAPDGQFHPLPVRKVLTELERLGIYVHEFHYECNLYGNPRNPENVCGEVVLLGFHQAAVEDGGVTPIGPRDLDPLHELDEVAA